MLDKVVAIVLAGGVGARLAPLTLDRAKPAVPFGGKYRIIDFTLSNCLHSGVRKILVLTQYKSHSLQKHVRDGWSIFNPELNEFVTTVPPQMRTGADWYLGTADAVYQNLYLLERSQSDWVLILSGDHIYRMDYAAMLRFHIERNADLTVACMEVGLDEARAFGVMTTNDDGRIVSFAEKPEQPTAMPGHPDLAMASMGVYIFNKQSLVNILKDAKDGVVNHDFGNDVIPAMIDAASVYGYRFGADSGRVTPDRYWRDVGTLDAFYEANMDLLLPVPPMDLYQKGWPIRTYNGQHPPARTVPGESGNEGIFINSIIANGTIIAGGNVQESVLCNNVFIDDESSVHRALLFDEVHVGKGAELRNCIVDKYVHIPDGEAIGVDLDADRQRFTVTDKGIVVVPKGYRFS